MWPKTSRQCLATVSLGSVFSFGTDCWQDSFSPECYNSNNLNVNYATKKTNFVTKHRKINKRIEVRINKLNSLTQQTTDIHSSNFLFRKVVFHIYSLIPLWLAVRIAMGILVLRASILLVSVGDTRYTILTKRIEALGTRMSSRRFWEQDCFWSTTRSRRQTSYSHCATGTPVWLC